MTLEKTMDSILRMSELDEQINTPCGLGGALQGPLTGSTEMPTISEVLQKKRCALMDQVRDIDLTLEELRNNPDVTKVLDLIRKCNRY
jgi:hypothetical protein